MSSAKGRAKVASVIVNPSMSTRSKCIKELMSYILSKNNLRSLPHKKLEKKLQISQLNGHVDLYNRQPIDARNSRFHLDHIFEVQCFAYVISIALHGFDGDEHGKLTYERLKDQLIKVINSDFNLNVTDRNTNLVKMNIFKEFIKRRQLDSHPSLLNYLRKSTSFDKNIYCFCSTLRDSCRRIRSKLQEYITESYKETSNNSNKQAYQRIIEEFDVFYNSMQIEDYDLLRYI